MKMKVINTSTMVKPATATPTTAVWISNMDAIMPEKLHVPIVYVYPSTGADDFFDAAVLKASLGRTLVEFYPLAGRLKKDVNGRIEIDCNGEGAVFVEAECDGTVEDFGDFIMPEINLVPKVDYSQGISTFPLFLVQVTRFRCCGVSLGILFEHHAMDGFSMDHFMNTWAKIARGGAAATTTTKPFLDRHVLSARNPPRPQFSHVGYLPPPSLKNPTDNSDVDISEMKFLIFKLTRNQLNALKAKCLQDEGNGVKYSTYETLAGHVWRCVCKARGLPEDQETNLYIPVEGRSRLRPPFPPGYFGNVVFRATATALCGELESNPLELAVRKIHEAMAQVGNDYLRSAIDYLEVHGDKLDPRVRGAACYKCPNLGVVSWARFCFHDTDFGWGCPIRLGFDRILPEGNTILLPTPTDDGGLLFAIVLPKEQMQVFEKLFCDI